MVEINHTPTEDDPNSYTVIGDSVDEIIEFCLPRIRQQSKSFYKESLKKDLDTIGESLIDRHAGNGNFYKVKLIHK